MLLPQSIIPYYREALIGTASALPVMAVIQPMGFFKAKLQGKDPAPLPLNPRVWYRGFVGNVASFAPTCVLQTFAFSLFSEYLSPIPASTLAGVLSSLVVAPSEAVMLRMQMTGEGWMKTARHIIALRGVYGLFFALTPTALREGGFSFGYLGAAPLLKRELKARGFSEGTAHILGASAAGVAAAVLTHPFDTIKSVRQRTLERGRVTNLFAGLLWRMPMVVIGVNLLPFFQEKSRRVFD